MTPKKYFLWFLWISLAAILGIYLATGNDTARWTTGVSAISGILAIPALINLFFGPTIYAFWRRKQSRGLIAFINILVVVGGGGFPGLLLWLWALKGKVRPPKESDSISADSPKREAALIGPLGWVLLALLVVLIGTIASTRTTNPNASAPISVSETQPTGSTPIDLSSPTTKKAIDQVRPEAEPSYPNGPFAPKNLPTIKRPSIPQLVAAAKPAIVKIEAYDAAGYPIKTGTGFFISADGIVVTNHHVIDGAKQISAEDLFGTFYRFESIFADDAYGDLTLLKFVGPAPRFLTLGSAATAQEGQRVLVIGNPEGLQGTVSDGLISSFRQNRELIQITAPISPGSSGSPVLDQDGKVIGVATLIFKEGQNLNFAISADRIGQAMRVAEHPAQLIPSPNLMKDVSPAPPQTAARFQRGNPWDFIVYVEKSLNEHNWGYFRAYIPPDGQLNYFGHRNATLEYRQRDMENDRKRYTSSKSTYYPQSFTHEISQEYSPRWSGPMLYDSINVYGDITERGGRVHRALTRLTVGYTDNAGRYTIYALVLKVLPK